MDFAKRMLSKYGWKEGDGLGKHNNGIAKPLKASLKFDNAGLGADLAADDLNNHWWERVFNEAAQNVEVTKQTDGGVSMDLKNHDDSVEISTKTYSTKKLKKAKNDGSGRSDARYNNFLQSATLTKDGDEVENPNKIAVADIAVTQYKALTDEELFKACGGRTAHKGARHGLKLNGKIARLEQQEQELLTRMQQKLDKNQVAQTNTGIEIKVKQKKSKSEPAENFTVQQKTRKNKRKTKNECEEAEQTHSLIKKQKTSKVPTMKIKVDEEATIKIKKKRSMEENYDINITENILERIETDNNQAKITTSLGEENQAETVKLTLPNTKKLKKRTSEKTLTFNFSEETTKQIKKKCSKKENDQTDIPQNILETGETDINLANITTDFNNAKTSKAKKSKQKQTI